MVKETTVCIPTENEFADGVVLMHKKLYDAHNNAYNMASMCIPDIKRTNTIKLYVNFKNVQPENGIKGTFMFNDIVFRFLTVSFDYAMLFPVIPVNGDRNVIAEGISFDEILKYLNSEKEYILTFSRLRRNLCGTNILYSSQIELCSDSRIKDDISVPYQTDWGIEKLRVLDIPENLKLEKYDFVPGEFYPPLMTNEKIDCVLSVSQSNEQLGSIIWVYRWFPIGRQKKMQNMPIPNAWGDVFFSLGMVHNRQGEKLCKFMKDNNSNILFGEMKNNKIKIIGGVDIFLKKDIFYPKSFSNIDIL